MRVLVTGGAGFIGFHVAARLMARGDAVAVFDVVNDYYDPALKEARLAELERIAAETGAAYRFHRADLADEAAVDAAFAQGIADRPGGPAGPFDRVIHLAAQAGVRYSLENPLAYVRSNILGFTHILEACRHAGTPHLTFASTSSVYGGNTTMPFAEGQGVDHPLQFYAATKRANELMAHAYAHLYRLPVTGLRFFTVYGPWGRPDMAPMLFARAISEGRPIKVFSHGRHSRDFTYVDDIVEGVIRASDRIATPDPDWDPARPDPATSNAPYRIYNIGNNAPVQLADFIAALETALGRPAIQEFLPPQPGDVPDTFADSSRLARAVNWRPATPIAEGVARFVDWYRSYHGAPSAEGEISGDPPAPGAPDP
ncbi:NAD-dependent epimerase [uncultured Amaricoccus sp.]|uniref:NAD-dependent epimerase n=1 Tax=uncultured Amaricoccus sp. TaxID=339341 RepID=UPI002633C9CC|nr:NAD-dependent epimerase [uncultured Amaricoccus sp.]